MIFIMTLASMHRKVGHLVLPGLWVVQQTIKQTDIGIKDVPGCITMRKSFQVKGKTAENVTPSNEEPPFDLTCPSNLIDVGVSQLLTTWNCNPITDYLLGVFIHACGTGAYTVVV